MASIKQMTEKNANISAILSFIRERGQATRMELSRGLSLSWACISDLVALLIEAEMLIEVAQEGASTTKGRTPTQLFLNEKKYVLGVDINDSGIAITTRSINGKSIASKKWAEEPFDCETELVRSVCQKISEMLFDKQDCCGIGVAMEGTRAADGGWNYPMKHGCVSVFPERFLAEHFDLPVAVKHDPECVLYSVAERCADCVMIRVDKWIGVAAKREGSILELPLELGWIRYGDKKLQTILRECAQKGEYLEIAEALGRSVGNLLLLLGIESCFLAGEISTWLQEVREAFDAAFRQANPQGRYELCVVSDASDGAARLAMAEYRLKRQTK